MVLAGFGNCPNSGAEATCNFVLAIVASNASIQCFLHCLVLQLPGQSDHGPYAMVDIAPGHVAVRFPPDEDEEGSEDEMGGNERVALDIN